MKPIFAVERIEAADGTTRITFRGNRFGAELATEPVLVIGDKTVRAVMTTDEGRMVAVFDNLPVTVGAAELVFPAVAVPVLATTTQIAALGIIEGPAGETYRIVSRDVDRAAGTVTLYYEPDQPDAPSITLAKVVAGELEVLPINLGSTYSPDWALTSGSITFPIGAEALLSADGATLVAEGFRAIETDRLSVQLGN